MADLRSAIADLATSRLTLRIVFFSAFVVLFFAILTTKANLDFALHAHTHPIFFHCLLVSKLGIKLLHSLSDEELLALASNSGDGFLSNALNQLPIWRGSNSMHRTCVSEISSKPKIAFLFLTTGALPLAPFWDQFFRGNEALYNIYIHSDPFFLDVPIDPSSPFWGRLIPSKRAEYDTPLIIAAVRRLLANALLDDPSNKFFVILSDSCIPIHGFDKVYRRIASSEKSFMEVFAEIPDHDYRYNARGDGVMLPEVKYEDFRVGSVFSVMTQKHALMFVKDKKFWGKFKLQCLHANCFPEEHYFPTMMNMLDPYGSLGFSLTLVDWSKADGPHPRLFTREDLNVTFIRHLQEKDGGRFMFARKFHGASLDLLLKLSPILLD